MVSTRCTRLQRPKTQRATTTTLPPCPPAHPLPSPHTCDVHVYLRCICTYIHIYIYSPHICDIYMYIYTYTHTHAHTHTHTHTHTYTYIHACIHTYIHTHVRRVCAPLQTVNVSTLQNTSCRHTRHGCRVPQSLLPKGLMAHELSSLAKSIAHSHPRATAKILN